MKKKASELKQGDFIMVAGEKCAVGSIELSEIGKQGSRKCRLELTTGKGEKLVIIRPADYPFEVA